MKNFWHEIKRPIKVLAPMAGYTDAAFRLLCHEFGADVTMSELISADAIAYAKLKVEKQEFRLQNSELSKGNSKLTYYRVVGKNQSTGDLLSFFEEERPFVVQLFGKNPDNFAKAARWVSENLKPDGIDINMGCPARKVVNSGHGVALMKDFDLAKKIIEAVVANTDLPVSVKTRLGWDDPDTILKFAPELSHAGIDAIIIHGRTYKQGFGGHADWDNIYKIKELLPDLVVIGNGSPAKAGEEQETSDKKRGKYSVINPSCPSSLAPCPLKNLDGYAIGRASFGAPWVFSGANLDESKLIEAIRHHAELSFATKGEYGLVEFRKHLLKYLSGFGGAKALRKEAVAVTSMTEIEEILQKIK